MLSAVTKHKHLQKFQSISPVIHREKATRPESYTQTGIWNEISSYF